MNNYGGASGGAVYGMGLIGALIYFLSHAANFGALIYGLFQAIFWPAYMVYYAFQALLR